MRTATVNVITVKRSGPHSYEAAKAMNSHPDDTGLYQIYGTHRIFGPDSLLYVGMTVSTFGDRLKQHSKWIEWESHPVSIYLGRLEDPQKVTDEDRKTQIEIAERLTVYFTAPPYNSALLTKSAWESTPPAAQGCAASGGTWGDE